MFAGPHDGADAPQPPNTTEPPSARSSGVSSGSAAAPPRRPSTPSEQKVSSIQMLVEKVVDERLLHVLPDALAACSRTPTLGAVLPSAQRGAATTACEVEALQYELAALQDLFFKCSDTCHSLRSRMQEVDSTVRHSKGQLSKIQDEMRGLKMQTTLANIHFKAKLQELHDELREMPGRGRSPMSPKSLKSERPLVDCRHAAGSLAEWRHPLDSSNTTVMNLRHLDRSLVATIKTDVPHHLADIPHNLADIPHHLADIQHHLECKRSDSGHSDDSTASVGVDVTGPGLRSPHFSCQDIEARDSVGIEDSTVTLLSCAVTSPKSCSAAAL